MITRHLRTHNRYDTQESSSIDEASPAPAPASFGQHLTSKTTRWVGCIVIKPLAFMILFLGQLRLNLRDNLKIPQTRGCPMRWPLWRWGIVTLRWIIPGADPHKLI